VKSVSTETRNVPNSRRHSRSSQQWEPVYTRVSLRLTMQYQLWHTRLHVPMTMMIKYSGSLYLSVISFRNTKVSHQTLNPTAELWCKTLSRIKVDVVLW